MPTPPAFAALSPAIQVHLVCAVGALLLGPLVLWARKGSPRHRGLGHAWVALMLGAALSSVFIRDFRLPNWAGYTPIHGLTVLTLLGVPAALWAAMRRRVAIHRRAMLAAYFGGCVGAGLFALLLPNRFLGQWLWGELLDPRTLAMLAEVLRRTPPWVWGVLAAITVAGAAQMRTQAVGRARLVAVPLALGGWSLWSALQTFGASALVLAAWTAGAAAALAANRGLRWPRGARPLADGRYEVPGSAWPLALMLGIFGLRYVAAAAAAMHPDWRQAPAFAAPLAAAGGALSGLFAARARQVLRSAGPARALPGDAVLAHR